jgi:hypothetical protein
MPDQSCLFRRGDYGNKGHSPEKSVLGSSPGEDNFFSPEIKHDRRMVLRPKLFRWGDYKNKGNIHENMSWLRVLLKKNSIAW